MNIKAFSLFMISTLIIGGMWISSCISDNILSDIIINTQSTITDDPQHAEEPEKPQCVITYPQFGKYGFQNILADDFVEAVPFSDNQVEYSVSVDVPVGASLKIVIKTIHEDSLFHWGVYAAHTIENWHVSTYDNVSRSNTLTVYESGKTAHVIVQIDTDCMIEYYENGANTPTKVKTIKLNTDAIVKKPDTKDVTYSGLITYPQFGRYGFQNILADDFVEAVPYSDKQTEYLVSADVPVGASLKIVIKTVHEDSQFHWGVYAAHTIENWHVSTYDNVSRSNTLTVYESGKTAYVIVQIDTDCMIEYYENGANTPTKVKIIKLNTDAIVEKPDTKDVTYSGVITYPKFGKFGLLNVLDTDFVEATPFDERLTEYSVCAEVPAGAGLKIVIKSIIKAEAWGVYYPHSVENWHVASYDNSTGSNTLTFGESGKTSNVTIQFDNDCIVEFYENGAKTPTKVKEIKVIR